jgi:hypothetical protein
MKADDIDTIAWIVGLIVLALGAALQWGWPASLLVVGGVFAIWPLVKTVVKAL